MLSERCQKHFNKCFLFFLKEKSQFTKAAVNPHFPKWENPSKVQQRLGHIPLHPHTRAQGPAPHQHQHHLGWGQTSYLLEGDDEEGAAAGTLCHDGKEAGVDSAEMVVVDILGDGDAVEAVLPARHLPIDVSKLGAAVLRAP